jgi:uncharacterized protein YunC (DUF1805 family)
MRYLLIAVLLFTAQSTKAQGIDALVLKAIDSAITAREITVKLDPAQFKVVNLSKTFQEVSLLNYSTMLNSGTVATKASTDVATLTSQLAAALTRITTLESQITSMAIKIGSLTAKTTVTAITTIQ